VGGRGIWDVSVVVVGRRHADFESERSEKGREKRKGERVVVRGKPNQTKGTKLRPISTLFDRDAWSLPEAL
jgi:hypothetical protein